MSEGSSNSSSNLAENLIQNEYPTYDELQKEFMKEVVMNAFLKVKIEELESKNGYLETEMATLNEDLKKSNEINIGLNKKINDLNITIDKLSNMVVFIRLTNKWKSNDYDYNRMTCCEKRCVHFYKLDGCCINGNGYVQIINESNMLKYNCCLKWKGVNKYPSVGVEHPFNRPFYNCLTYSMFYFEIKCQMEEDKNSLENCLVIGLNNNNCAIRFRAHESVILHKINYIDNQFRLTSFVWNDLDVFGCGLVYPPTKMQGKLPYIFFTQNGKQIGKAVLLRENYNTYFPYVFLKCCSVEANFGHDLNAKPLIYDVSKHVVAEEFYE